jgi:glucokinase
MSLPAEGEGAVVGVDVGGTKIRAGVVRGTEVVEMVERPTDVASAEAVIGGLEGAVRELTARTAPPSAVGVGLPSQIDFRAGRVLTSVNIPLADVPFRDALTERLGVPVQLDNDANCAALAEAGAAAGGSVRELVMLTLGTGVGGGVVIGGCSAEPPGWGRSSATW